MDGPFTDGINATPYLMGLIRFCIEDKNTKNTEFLRYTDNGLILKSTGGIYAVTISQIMED